MSRPNLTEITQLNVKVEQAMTFAALNYGLLALWEIYDYQEISNHEFGCGIALSQGTGADAWMGGLAILAAISTPFVDQVANRLYKQDLVKGVFTYDYVEVARSDSLEGDTISHALWNEYVAVPGSSDFWELCNNWRVDENKVEQIVTRWGERLEARLRKEVGNG